MRTEYADRVPKASLSLAREFISHFLPILLSDRQVEIIIDDEDQIHLTKLVRGELLIDKRQTHFAVGSRKFSLLSVKLRPKQISLRHRLILAASAREVSGHNLEKFIPVLTPGPLELENEPDGFFFVSIVEGEYLDEVVDPMRVTFTDEDEDQTDEDEAEVAEEPLVRSPDLFGEPQSIGEIRREALKIVQEQLNAYLARAGSFYPLARARTDAS